MCTHNSANNLELSTGGFIDNILVSPKLLGKLQPTTNYFGKNTSCLKYRKGAVYYPTQLNESTLRSNLTCAHPLLLIIRVITMITTWVKEQGHHFRENHALAHDLMNFVEAHLSFAPFADEFNHIKKSLSAILSLNSGTASLKYLFILNSITDTEYNTSTPSKMLHRRKRLQSQSNGKRYRFRPVLCSGSSSPQVERQDLHFFAL